MTDDRWDDVEAAPPSREPVSARGRRTRAKLLESGREALAHRGHNNTRVDDVVSRAGTSHGTFYLYFENIEDLLAGVIDECDAAAATLLEKLGAARPGDLGAMAGVLDDFGRHRERYGDIASPWVQPEGAQQSRAAALAQHLSTGADQALAVLALIDRVLPELDQMGPDASRRVANLIDGVRRSDEPQVASTY
ncbi:MAG: TetR/AcrR family transcriptional regulator [Acidimicrobiales bacterium]